MPAPEPAHKRWYKTSRWQKLRTAHLRDEPLCRMCLNDGTVEPASVCDHITPHQGDEALFWSGPFQSLCKWHHDSQKAREENGRGPQRVDADGWPVGG